MTGFISVHITASSEAEAASIAEALVAGKLAACANIMPTVKSVYRWKGAVEHATEVLVIAKSRAELFGDLSKKVKELHSYDCPCIVALPIVAGSPDYLQWLADETR